jgi:hypothetical protein
MEYRRQLKGWQAVVAAMVILGIVGYQCARRIQTVDDAARFAIGVSLTRREVKSELRQSAVLILSFGARTLFARLCHPRVICSSRSIELHVKSAHFQGSSRGWLLIRAAGIA